MTVCAPQGKNLASRYCPARNYRRNPRRPESPGDYGDQSSDHESPVIIRYWEGRLQIPRLRSYEQTGLPVDLDVGPGNSRSLHCTLRAPVGMTIHLWYFHYL